MARRFDYDLAILGGGSAGIVAGNVAGALGARVALVERARIGGECLWTGCVPSKALLHVADVADTIRNGASFGLRSTPLAADDCAGAFAYVRAKIEETRTNDASETMLRDFGVQIFHGDSDFISPNVLRTPGGDIKSAAFLLAMGSSPVVPPIPGLAETGYLTNQTLFDLDAVPESIIMIGGGAINVEMAQALARLGAKVTLLCREPRLLHREDAELTDILTTVLQRDGVQIIPNAAVETVSRGDGGKTVRARVANAVREFAAQELMVSVGRRANTNRTNLADVGVRLDRSGNVVTQETGQTDAPHIWACGDVTGRFRYSHMAEHEAKIVVRNILFPGSQNVPYNIVPWATFTQPELARVGLTEIEAQQAHGKIQVLRHTFRQDDRAIVEGRTTGLVKIITAGANGGIVGAHILGPGAGDTIHEWVLAMQQKLPVRVLADMIHVYSTFSVSNQRAAQKWYAQLSESPLLQTPLRWLGFTPRSASQL